MTIKAYLNRPNVLPTLIISIVLLVLMIVAGAMVNGLHGYYRDPIAFAESGWVSAVQLGSHAEAAARIVALSWGGFLVGRCLLLLMNLNLGIFFSLLAAFAATGADILYLRSVAGGAVSPMLMLWGAMLFFVHLGFFDSMEEERNAFWRALFFALFGPLGRRYRR